jgi:hypothetical protein
LNLNTRFRRRRAARYVRALVITINAKDLNLQMNRRQQESVFDVLALSCYVEGLQVDKIVRTYVMKLPVKSIYDAIRRFVIISHFHSNSRALTSFAWRFVKTIGENRLGEPVCRNSEFEKVGLTLSGVVLERLTLEQWPEKRQYHKIILV